MPTVRSRQIRGRVGVLPGGKGRLRTEEERELGQVLGEMGAAAVCLGWQQPPPRPARSGAGAWDGLKAVSH